MFFSKKKDPKFPHHFGLIRNTFISLSKGITDDYNKVIIRYLNGKVVETLPYSEQTVNALRKTYNIPIVEDMVIEDEDMEFNTVIDAGVLKHDK